MFARAFLTLLLAAGALAHSWLNNPAARFPSTPGYVITKDDGSVYYENNQNVPIGGSDAQGVNIMGLRPTTWDKDPCYYRSGHNWAGAPNAVVQRNSPMCADWNSNGHIADPTRNAGGGIRFSMIPFKERPTQAEFDANILARGIPYEYISGVKFQIPDVPAGMYTLQFLWYWPTPSRNFTYASCADIRVLNPGDPLLTNQQSFEYGLGLPKAFHAPADWRCNPSDPVYSNTTSGPLYQPPASATGKTATATSATAATSSTGSATGSVTSGSSSGSASSGSGSSSGSSGTCRAGISFSQARKWDNGGLVTITVSNTGTQPIKSINLNVPGAASTQWNLRTTSTPNMYTLPWWGLPLAAGEKFSWAGYTYFGSQPAAGSVLSVSC